MIEELVATALALLGLCLLSFTLVCVAHLLVKFHDRFTR